MAIATDDFKTTACNLCFVNCGIKVQLGGDDGRQFVKVLGDENHPASNGYICNKASRINYYQNNENRLLHPMKRQPDGSYQPVSWDTAITEIADKLSTIKADHGGQRIFYYGGGSQGNHLGGTYAMALRNALGVRYKGNAISQEKTGLAWVFSRMIGGLVHAEVTHAQVAMFVGKNPFMSNGMDQARLFLREIRKDPKRKLIVVDPRRTETADYADIHLAVKPGRDAWAMTAIFAWIVQNNKLPMDWLAKHAHGAETVITEFSTIPVEDFARFAGLEPELVIEAAKTIAEADSFALEEDIGIQMAPHSTLVTYLNHLVQLATGNYGKPGTMGMTTQLAPLIDVDYGPVDEEGRETARRTLPVTGAPIVSGLFPGAFLTEEILNDHPDRTRALIVESSNPVHSLPQANKLRTAIRSLELSLAIDVAMTETAMECDYVLPAHTQYEKWEATYFPRNFPANYYHMRAPILEPPATTLGEPEIHSRIIDALGMFEQGELEPLSAAANEGLDAYKAAFFEAMASNPKIGKMLSHVLYRTLGPSLPEGQAATAATWGLCQVYAMKHPAELARAGCSGGNAGTELWQKIVSSPSGAIIGESTYEESFARIPHPDNKIQLVIRELLDELEELKKLQPLVDTSDEYPFALVAGVRRAYTANCAIRDPRWVKGKMAFALTMHPEDGAAFDLPEGSRVRLKTETGEATVELAYDERNHRGQISVPNGQGMAFTDEEGNELYSGVFVNELTSTTHRDKFIGTPFHKFVPASVTRA